MQSTRLLHNARLVYLHPDLRKVVQWLWLEDPPSILFSCGLRYAMSWLIRVATVQG